jgi:hypothetical protein
MKVQKYWLNDTMNGNTGANQWHIGKDKQLIGEIKICSGYSRQMFFQSSVSTLRTWEWIAHQILFALF